MRKSSCIRIHRTGGPEVLEYESVSVEKPLAGEIQIRHYAIGVNYIDTYFRSGLYPLNLPSGLGMEGAGIVEEIGDGVTSFKVGDRVAYPHSKPGSYSEYHNVDAKQCVHIPKSISFETAAALMLKGLTVQYLFRQIKVLERGDTILFHACAGGVGLLACQWAKHLGVKLIGTTSSSEKADLAKKFGAYEVINYLHENIPQRLLEITNGKKVSVVYDSVGKATWEQSLECLSPRGLMVSFGNASGPVTGVNLSQLAQKGSLFVTRPILGHFIDTPEKLNAAASELFRLVEEGVLEVKIDQTFKLQEAIEAHRILESRKTTGSTILIP